MSEPSCTCGSDCPCARAATNDTWAGAAFPELKPSLARRLLLRDEA